MPDKTNLKWWLGLDYIERDPRRDPAVTKLMVQQNARNFFIAWPLIMVVIVLALSLILKQ